ncbi:hypothetical protein CC80DRAFT_510931 [Byssothecium circinans]|uniref:Uncharacterized protein n=1 Tax=Byssothecium circinans TaxID=147558 RepID=A0A6A5T8V4_9PLEO|nr:hypothetical protein CC80DRAFT_510931 [Byssothecium circinans]
MSLKSSHPSKTALEPVASAIIISPSTPTTPNATSSTNTDKTPPSAQPAPVSQSFPEVQRKFLTAGSSESSTTITTPPPTRGSRGTTPRPRRSGTMTASSSL